MLIVSILCGCSALQFGYDQAEPAVRWWLDRQLDLNATQSGWLKEELRPFHAWHRQTQLPAYADLAARLARQSIEEVSPAQACENIDSAAAHLTVLLRQAAPLLAGLARQLDPAQVQHLKRRFGDADREWHEKWIETTPERRLRQRQEDWVERAESYYGRLSREQRDFIRQALLRSSWDPQLSWERRQQRQQQILAILEKILRERLSQPAAEAEITALTERLLLPEDPRLAAMQHQLRQEACANLSALHQLAGASQRSRAREKLTRYEKDFRQLAAK